MDKPKSNDTSNSVVVISPIVLIVAKNCGNISPCIDDVPRAEEIPTNDVWLPTALLLIVAWHWIQLMISSFLHKFGGNFTSKCLQIQKDFNRNTRLFDWTYITWHVTCHFHWAIFGPADFVGEIRPFHPCRCFEGAFTHWGGSSGKNRQKNRRIFVVSTFESWSRHSQKFQIFDDRSRKPRWKRMLATQPQPGINVPWKGWSPSLNLWV